MSLANELGRVAALQGDHPCLKYGDAAWSYGEFDDLVSRRAAFFLDSGLKAGQVVALIMENAPSFLLNFLGLNRIGVAVALINTNLSGNALDHVLRVAGPSAIIVDKENLQKALPYLEKGKYPFQLNCVFADTQQVTGEEDLRNLIYLPEAFSSMGQVSREIQHTPGVSDLAAYIYTSGTTGLPKGGRIINSRMILAGTGFGGYALGMGPWDTVYCCLPLFHSNGLLVATASALCNGSTLALAKRFSASKFWDDVVHYQATVFIYIGEICRFLMAQPERPTERQHRLRAMLGNGMRTDVWSSFVERFKPGVVHEFYGATEGNVNMINLTGKVGSVGRMPPIKSLNNALLVRYDCENEEPLRNDQGRCLPCSTGEEGELLGRIDAKRGTQRFDGYADSRDSEKKVLRDVLEEGDAYFRTGDLLRQDRWGNFYFVDRIGDTFRWKGENVSTFEVSDVIGQLAQINAVAVYGVSVSNTEGKAGMAAVTLHEKAVFEPEAFYAYMSCELPNYARPAFVRVVQSLDMTATFKLRKVDLVRDEYDPSHIDDPLYFRDDTNNVYAPVDPDVYRRICSGDIRF
jgi:fatty-acyl-CoA synthase